MLSGRNEAPPGLAEEVALRFAVSWWRQHPPPDSAGSLALEPAIARIGKESRPGPARASTATCAAGRGEWSQDSQEA